MPRYACFTTQDGAKTWWELVPDHEHIARLVFDKYGKPYPYRNRVFTIRTREQYDEGVPRTDHDELPDEVWARIVAHMLTEGSD